MHPPTPKPSTERVALAIVWGAASAALLAWAVLSFWKVRAVLATDLQTSLGVLALVSAVSLAGMALAAALLGRWRYVLFLAHLVTWPLSAFAAWAAAWSVVAMLAAPGAKTVAAVLVPVLALYVMHRTRRVSRELGAGHAPRPAPLRDAA